MFLESRLLKAWGRGRIIRKVVNRRNRPSRPPRDAPVAAWGGRGARGGRPTHLGLGVRAQADGSERRARGLAAPEHARARHARPGRPTERPSGAYSGGFAD